MEEAFVKRESCLLTWIESILDTPVGSIEGKTLIELLQNGVIVCKLMSALKSRSIPRIHENTTFQFKTRENCQFFLGALEDLGISRYDLFATQDLHQAQNPVKVVECLETLAKFCATKHGQDLITLNPVPELPTEPTRTFEKCSIHGDADLLSFAQKRQGQMPRTLRQIRAVANRPATSSAASSSSTSNATTTVKVQPKHAFSSLTDKNATWFQKKAARTIQRNVRGYLARRQYQQMKRHQAYRNRVAKEIFDSEVKYIKNLEVLLNVYAGPLKRATKPIVDTEFTKKVFSDIDVILGYSGMLHDQLKQRIDVWDENPNQCIGDVFIRYSKFFRVYTQYVNTYDDRVDSVKKESDQNKKFAAFLTKADAEPSVAGLNLPAFLILPVQRIPRYEMLLKDMLKHTWKGHADYENLDTAYQDVKKAAMYVNNRKRESENIRQVLGVQGRLFKATIRLPLSHRSLELEQKAYASETRHNEKTALVVFLFNDGLLITSPKDKKLKKLKVLLWLDCKRWDAVPLPVGSTTPIGVRIVDANQSSRVMQEMFFKNTQLTQTWITTWQKVKDALANKEVKPGEHIRQIITTAASAASSSSKTPPASSTSRRSIKKAKKRSSSNAPPPSSIPALTLSPLRNKEHLTPSRPLSSRQRKDIESTLSPLNLGGRPLSARRPRDHDSSTASDKKKQSLWGTISRKKKRSSTSIQDMF